ncbi:hypothetical protein GCM10009595_12890 [Falsarthrobacter nasiphocae]
MTRWLLDKLIGETRQCKSKGKQRNTRPPLGGEYIKSEYEHGEMPQVERVGDVTQPGHASIAQALLDDPKMGRGHEHESRR